MSDALHRSGRVALYTDTGLWGTQTLHGLLERNAAAHPHREAVVDQPDKNALTGQVPQRLTFRQLDHASSTCAATLAGQGLVAGDAVMLQLPNTAELIVLYYALSKLGVVISPIAVQYAEHEIKHFAKELRPAAFITISELRGVNLVEQAKAVLSDVPVWDVLSDIDVFAGAETPPDAPPSSSTSWVSDANVTLTIAWTSGTTGTPKGVPRTHNMWIAQGNITSHAAQFQDGERLLSPFPMINMAALGGFLFPSALHCCTLVLHHPLDSPQYSQQLQDESMNYTLAPTPHLNRLAPQQDMWS